MLHALTLYLGRAEIWLTFFEDYARMARPFLEGGRLAAARSVCLAQLGRLEEAHALVGPQLDELETSGLDDETPTLSLIRTLQAAVVLRHRRAASTVSRRLACVAHLSQADGGYIAFVARHLGDAAELTGDSSAAREYYAQALEAAGKIGFRPEIALAHVGLAELLVDESEHSAALEHLDVAIPELQDMHMQPGLESALTLRDRCQSARAHAPTRQVFSDTLTVREREMPI
jgi:tetratricopeptide (TPR) repeat protein